MWINPLESEDLAKFTGEILNGKFYFLCSVKFWCLGKAKRNVYGPNIKGLTKEYMDQIIYGPNWDLIVAFWVLGLRTNQNKTFRSHSGGIEALVYYGHKEFIISNVLEAKSKIYFGKYRIH